MLITVTAQNIPATFRNNVPCGLFSFFCQLTAIIGDEDTKLNRIDREECRCKILVSTDRRLCKSLAIIIIIRLREKRVTHTSELRTRM